MGLPFLLLAYATGLGCAPFLTPPPFLPAAPFAAALLWLPLRRRRGAGALLLAFLFLLGLALYHLRVAPPHDPRDIRAFAGIESVAVEGTVLAVAPRHPGRWALDLETRRVASGGIAAAVRGRLRLTVEEGPAPAQPGETVRFLTRLRVPRAFGTPGEFNYPRHLAARGIYVTASVPRSGDVANLGPTGEAGFLARAQAGRAGLGRFIDGSVPPETAPLVRALVIGDKGGVPPEVRDLLARAGLSHLFAISGLHLGLIAAMLYGGGLLLWRRSETLLLLGPPRRWLPPLLLPALLAYLLLTGGALATVRSFLMLSAGALLFVGCRRTPPARLLAAAAFVILCLEPLALFEPSFQLSVAGVLGIVALLPRWRPALAGLPKPLRWGATLLATTGAATLATAPLVLLHFHLLAPAGLLTNLFAVPAIGLAGVPLGLLGGALAPLWPAGAAALLHGCGALLQATLALAERVVALPLLGGWPLHPSLPQVAALSLAAAAALLPGGNRRRRTARLALLLAAPLLLAWRPEPPPLALTALSVGQGEALLLSRGGRHYLIDGGGLYSDTFDVGERLVAPALGRLGVDALEAVVLSHDHPDHRKGLPYLLEHFPAGTLWTSHPAGALHPSLLEAARRRGVPLRLAERGWTVLEETPESALALFAPDQGGDSLNDRSLVLYARQGEEGLLLTGDLEEAGVAELLADDPPPGPVTLLKLPHHGSRHSAPEALLDRFAPRIAFASLGAGNPYRLPAPSVVTALQRRRIPLYRTDLQGTLRFETGGSGWRVLHWEKGLLR